MKKVLIILFALFSMVACNETPIEEDLSQRDQVAPLIVTTSPSSNEFDVADYSNITIQFNEELDANSVNTINVTVIRNNISTSGSVIYDSATKTITFTLLLS